MKYLKVAPYIIIVILCLMVGALFLKTKDLEKDLSDLSSLTEITLKELDTERFEHKSAIDLLKSKDEYSVTLEQQIAALKARPDQIKYVVRTETILEAGPAITVKELPESYTFRLKNGLAVAAIKNKQDHIDLLTHDLTLRGQVALTENKASASIQASSSDEPENWIEVPVELQVIQTEKTITIEPHVGIGLAAGYPWNVSGTIWSTFVHFPNSIDLGGVAILANDQNLQMGLIPIAYNIGDPLPILTNTWVAPVATLNIEGQPGASLILGSKF